MMEFAVCALVVSWALVAYEGVVLGFREGLPMLVEETVQAVGVERVKKKILL